MAYSPKSQIRRRQLRTRTSAQDREPALLGQPVQRGLHHRTYVLVHLGDVRVLAELRGDVDRLEDLGDNLRWQRNIRREDHAQAERETEAHRQDVHPSLGQAEFAGPPVARGQEQPGSLSPDRAPAPERSAAGAFSRLASITPRRRSTPSNGPMKMP